MRTLRTRMLLLVVPFFAGLAVAMEPNPPPRLSEPDKKLLADLIGKHLFNPRGARRVSVIVPMQDADGHRESVERNGWLVKGTGGKPTTVYFTAGDSMTPRANDWAMLNFEKECQKYLANASENPGLSEREYWASVGLPVESALVRAAWLHCLGQDDLAARALALARKQYDNPVRELREDLCWSLFAYMVHSYIARQDKVALNWAEQLFRLYPAESQTGGDRRFGHRHAALERLRADWLGRFAAGRGNWGILCKSQVKASCCLWPKKRSAAVVPSGRLST